LFFIVGVLNLLEDGMMCEPETLYVAMLFILSYSTVLHYNCCIASNVGNQIISFPY